MPPATIVLGVSCASVIAVAIVRPLKAGTAAVMTKSSTWFVKVPLACVRTRLKVPVPVAVYGVGSRLRAGYDRAPGVDPAVGSFTV